MFFKITLLALFVVSAHASGGYSSFSYGVTDPHTGDIKSQHEKRVGNSVIGQYSLLESDGTKRIVDYSANPHTGFNAVVRKDPVAIHPATSAYGSGLGYAAHAVPVAPVAYSHAAPIAAAPITTPLAPIATPIAPLAYNHAPAVSTYSTAVSHPPSYGSLYNSYSPYSANGALGYSGYGGYGSYAGYGNLPAYGDHASVYGGLGYAGYGQGISTW